MMRSNTSEYQRKTSRQLVLESLKQAKQQQSSKASNLAASRKTPKRIKLGEVKDSTYAQTSRQEEGTTSHGASGSGKAILLGGQQVPDKEILEYVIDILQKKDKWKIFAKPVDGNLVIDYYEVIKHPMDFDTMLTKLREDSYATLKQFQDDIILICKNAMHYNSSSTIYHKEAREIHELAIIMFTTLETCPEKIFEEFPNKKEWEWNSTRGAEGSSAKVGKRAKGKRPANQRQTKRKISVPKNKVSANYNDAGWRHTYHLSTSREKTYLCSPKQPILGHYGESQTLDYEETLRRFVKDLGPVAQKVANQKLEFLYQARRQSSLLHETPEHGNYTGNVMTDSNNSLSIRSSDPRQIGKMNETNPLARYSSGIPSSVGPFSSMHPSRILRETSSGLSENVLSYTELLLRSLDQD